MEVSRVSVKPFKAVVTFGLNRNYSDSQISSDEVIEAIQRYQDKLVLAKKVYLSISVSDSVIVMSHQKEPHVVLKFINYPKFPLNHKELKFEIESLVRYLMDKFSQNRTVVEYLNETVMFECTDQIDPRIVSS